MGSIRMRMATAGVAVALALLGGVACGDSRGNDNRPTSPATPTTSARTLADLAAAPASATPDSEEADDAAAPAGSLAPAATVQTPPTLAPNDGTPTVEDVQALIASMTAQLQEAAASGPGTPPPTSEEIEAQLREQLRQLGIPL